jgi:hypothetical protein
MDDRSERLCNGKLKVEHVHVYQAAASFTADLGEAVSLEQKRDVFPVSAHIIPPKDRLGFKKVAVSPIDRPTHSLGG